MTKLKVQVKYDLCKPEKCDPGTGTCAALKVCTRRVLEQEEAFESPVCFSCDMCQGCGDCAGACPLDAIRLA